MSELDSMLRTYADKWRAGEAPPPDLEALVRVAAVARRRSRVVPAVAASAAAAVAAVAIALTVARPGNDTDRVRSPPYEPTGTVTGQLVSVGGPANVPPSVDTRGTIYAYANADGTGRALATTQVDRRGRFTLTIRPASYYLRGSTPYFTIDPAPAAPPCLTFDVVNVVADRIAHADVYCEMR